MDELMDEWRDGWINGWMDGKVVDKAWCWLCRWYVCDSWFFSLPLSVCMRAHERTCMCMRAHERTCVCMFACVSSSPPLAVGVSVIISTSVAMETISVTIIGFITRRVGTRWTGKNIEQKWQKYGWAKGEGQGEWERGTEVCSAATERRKGWEKGERDVNTLRNVEVVAQGESGSKHIFHAFFK